ncbi:hypothetical protein N8613_02575 [Verrucomicrobia bacterium]|nr:hypothetical protein [Verrucomicrobiota bacterium]
MQYSLSDMVIPTRRLVTFFCLFICGWVPLLALAQSKVTISRAGQGNTVAIHQSSGNETEYQLEVSSDMDSWKPWALSWGPFQEYLDLGEVADSARFYRIKDMNSKEAPDWTNQLGLNPEPLASAPRYKGDLTWVKFAIPLDQSGNVYFQNSRAFPFHFDFATRFLPAFSGMNVTEFENISLIPATQEVVLGAVLFPSNPLVRELGIQFVGREFFSSEKVLNWLNLVSQRLRLEGDWQVFYMPTFEQKERAVEEASLFKQQGFPVDSPSRWVMEDALYSEGWALGRLQFVDANELEDAFSKGNLLSTDILILDSVPAEVPPVAGIIVLSPATPNAHVAILAKSQGIPFAFVADQHKQAQLMHWVGDDALFIASENEQIPDIKTLRVETQLTDEQKDQLLALKQAPKLDYTSFEHANQLTFQVADLTPEHLSFVGGKAANLGFLLRSLPDHAPQEAIAFSFDLWTEFMAQTMSSGLTLKEMIAIELNALKFPVEDPAHFSLRLRAIRTWIKDEASFSVYQQQKIIQALEPLDANRRIRFRSSTNVEDSEYFSGAGLYDSFSGCLADEQDQDDEGPSACDSTKKNERGVFRAIQKVFASFYNENAFIERLRRGVNEDEVGMAILAHYSFPDQMERANGVATLKLEQREDGTLELIEGTLVTQKDAVSVANPDSVAAPEVVALVVSNEGDITHEVVQASGLVQLGATVLDWPEGYTLLTELLRQASDSYLEFFVDKTEVWLDFEYKYISPGSFVIKQIRELPVVPVTGQLPPVTFSNVDAFEVVQGEFGDMMARHRLKSIWRFQSWGIIGEDLPQNPVDLLNVDLEFLHDHKKMRFEGNLNALPGAEVRVNSKSLIADWYWGEDQDRVDYRLEFDFLYRLDQRPSPFLDLSDAEIELTAHYATRRPELDLWRNRVTMINQDSVKLADIDPADTKLGFPHVTWKRRVKGAEEGVSISSQFFIGTYKFRGETPWILKTMVLQGWGGTNIAAKDLDPFELHSTFSQTYFPGHHNFIETLILEPRLEPNFPEQLLTEMESRNIRAWILMHDSANVNPTLTSKIQVLTLDNRLIDL